MVILGIYLLHWLPVRQSNILNEAKKKLSMTNLFEKAMQTLNETFVQQEQLFVNAEDEDLVMSCGAFNPRFLAKIKRSKAENQKSKLLNLREYFHEVLVLSPGRKAHKARP